MIRVDTRLVNWNTAFFNDFERNNTSVVVKIFMTKTLKTTRVFRDLRFKRLKEQV